MVYKVIRWHGLLGLVLPLLAFSCSPPKFQGLEEASDAGIDTGPQPGTDAGQQVLPSHCSDGVHNGLELGIDCGGGCSGCDPGSPCKQNSDCSSSVCEADLCASPACDDGVKNGDEGDVDCGGSCVSRCADGRTCRSGPDCISLSCQTNLCQPPSCSDEIENGIESDVDCGGTDCPQCTFGLRCRGHRDCASNVCDEVCVALTCTNQLPDPGETDLDCGGEMCKACAEGNKCVQSSDCATDFCNPHKICAVPSCTDLFRNQDETGTDCGGMICDPCADGQGCQGPTDCVSGYCNPDATCSTPNCSDGWKNKNETDVDCGGPDCSTQCADGRACKIAQDCQDNYCSPMSVCRKPTCSDGWKNQTEGDVDCGGPCATKCALDRTCNVAGDCASPNHCGVGGTCIACQTNCTCKLNDGKEYQFCSTTRQQVQAVTYCSNGTELARIDSETENNWVKGQAATLNLSQYWLGGTIQNPSCLQYAWSNGDIFVAKTCGEVTPGTFHNFAGAAPTGLGCVYSASDGSWYDAGCADTNSRRPYVCRTK